MGEHRWGNIAHYHQLRFIVETTPPGDVPPTSIRDLRGLHHSFELLGDRYSVAATDLLLTRALISAGQMGAARPIGERAARGFAALGNEVLAQEAQNLLE
jgi:hypothetical protein